MINTDSIREHMEVISSDGAHVGRVDHCDGDQIELAKFDFGAGLKHHLIPVSWIERIDDHVHLNLPADQAKAQWAEKH